MNTLLLMAVGYVVWCSLAFFVARFIKMENTNHQPISFIYIIVAAPLVIVEFITGKGTIR